jgi:hypothetical protein
MAIHSPFLMAELADTKEVFKSNYISVPRFLG